MRYLAYLLLFAGGLQAQSSPMQEITSLIQQAEESPAPQTEAIARKAISLLNHYYPNNSDPQTTLFRGQLLDLLAYGLAYRGQIDSALLWCDSAYRLLRAHGHIEKALEVKGNLAYYYHLQGKIPTAISIHKEVAALAQAYKKRDMLFYTYHNLASIFQEIGLPDSAIVLYKKALLIADTLNDLGKRSYTLSNLAVIYENLQLYDYALKYAWEVLKTRLIQKDSTNLSNTYATIARLHESQGNLDSAIIYARKAYLTAEQINHSLSKATAAALLGVFFITLQKWDSAHHYFQVNLRIRSKLSPIEQFKAYVAIANFYQRWAESFPPHQRQPLLYKALEYIERAHKIGLKEIYDASSLENFYLNAYKIYESISDYEKAYKFHQIYISLRDSLRSSATQRKAIESKYQYEWLQEERKLREEMLRQQITAQEKQKRQQLWIGFFAVLAFILGVAGAALFHLYRRTRQQRNQIIRQKAEIEHSYTIISQQHEELTKSLRYARRIQQALLPSIEAVQSLPFPQALWYQPQGEVGGDFYWIRDLGQGKYLLILGDCTGHGVPGGFMTVLSITLIEKALEIENFQDLPSLARFLHENFIHFLHGDHSEGLRDGMEGSFVLLNLIQGTIQILNAGATAWWMDKNGEIHELSDSGPGLGEAHIPPESLKWGIHELYVDEVRRLTLATDGVRDQLNPNRKKWGRKGWREALQKAFLAPPSEAIHLLRQEWENHRKSMPQIDDISVWMIDLPPLSNKIA
ncbi:MAG: tetratricopeptide repeat protein [Bacteroidia bacterium]|nr:tetratricopeptide repeat protein [Bacteroidia bacterium]MDW8133667.1 tetratricopeptide repeat protein [Bacteroidia bacterium]